MAIHPNQKEIFVIGCGRWGTFIAWYLDKIGHTVTLYGRESSPRMQPLMQERKNEQLTLSDSLQLTTDLRGCLNADIVVISIGAQQLAGLAEQLQSLGLRGKTLVLCMKGIEIGSGRRLSQICAEALAPANKIAVWLGPGHVQEFYRGVPNCMVIDSEDEQVKEQLVQAFSGDLIRFYYGTDLIGNEIGGAAKNVIGIAAGMLEGAGLCSLKGALMARGTREIARLIQAMGGQENTAYGLCHLGDYEATLFSPHSQNLAFGRAFIRGEQYEKLAEGYYTAKALKELSAKYQVELPICEAVYRILYENVNPDEMLQQLFHRSLKNEF